MRLSSRYFALTMCAATTLFVSGCDGTSCTTDVKPSVIVNITDDNLTPQICQGQARAWTGDQVFYQQGFYYDSGNGDHVCQFYFGHETPGQFSINIQLQGYEPIALTDIQVSSNTCHVNTQTLNLNLIPATTNCHDGYSWVNDRCESLHGCPFPQFERAFIPGANPEEGIVEISYDCLDECSDELDTHPAQPEIPGVCRSLLAP